MKLTRVPPPVHSIRLNGINVHYTVRRSARAKHMRITVSPHDGLVVTFPARIRQYINPDDFIREKQDWVLRHLARVGLEGPPRPLQDGAPLFYRGSQLELSIIRDGVKAPRFSARDGNVRAVLPRDFDGDLRTELRAWYRRRASEVIRREVEIQAERIGVRYRGIAVRDQKTKWGSCSRRGTLSFNWRLILFPPAVLRYVVVHELCHLRHFNHSPAFWSLVERHVPEYRKHVEWLRENGPRLEGALRNR